MDNENTLLKRKSEKSVIEYASMDTLEIRVCRDFYVFLDRYLEKVAMNLVTKGKRKKNLALNKQLQLQVHLELQLQLMQLNRVIHVRNIEIIMTILFCQTAPCY